MGCGSSLVLNKMQLLMKNIMITGQELHILLTWEVAFGCVERGQGQELQGWRLEALSLYCWTMMKWQRKTYGSPTSHHPPTGTQAPQKSKGKMQAYLYKYEV